MWRAGIYSLWATLPLSSPNDQLPLRAARMRGVNASEAMTAFRGNTETEFRGMLSREGLRTSNFSCICDTAGRGSSTVDCHAEFGLV